MALNFRIAAIGIAAVGLALGVAFGAGVAYGRGDPKTVESGLTQQQIQSLLGISGAAASGAPGGAAAGQGTQGQGTQQQRTPATNTQGGTQQASSTTTAGRVTSIDGSTITIQTAQGSQKVNLGASTSVSKIATGAAPDLTTGLTIFATGSRKEDGSFDAASITQVPPELQSMLSGGATGQNRVP